MNDAPFFTLVAADSDVQAIFGTSPVRVYPFDYAVTKGDKLSKPYATFQLTGGLPANNLSDRPCSDSIDLQVDIYGTTVAETRAAANAIEYAIELDCQITRIMSESIEGATKLYRTTFLTQWFINR